MATKNYEVGGMMESDSCGKPGKPRCRQKFKSKGKSKETKGGILGTLGAVAAGALGYGAYKKLKKEQKGGATKYQKGGPIKIIKKRINKDGSPVTLDSIEKDMTKKAFENIKKNKSGLKLSPEQELRKKVKEDIEKRSSATKMQKGGIKKYKTGGMVNSNAKVSADSTPGSKGVKPGVNPKAAASKVARGRVGGISTAPKKATPGKK
jgi:hypothetical protein